MSYRIVLHPKILPELNEVCEWYEQRSENLGIEFKTTVAAFIERIAANPHLFSKKKGNYREAITAKFPYTIIYEIIEKEQTVFIFNISHTSRNLKKKYKR